MDALGIGREVECWSCGRLMPREHAEWVREPTADGTGFALVQAGSCDACVAAVNEAISRETRPRPLTRKSER